MSLESANEQHNYYHPLSVAASLNATKNSGHTFCIAAVCPKLCSYIHMYVMYVLTPTLRSCLEEGADGTHHIELKNCPQLRYSISIGENKSSTMTIKLLLQNLDVHVEGKM
jgi:hypothetical protein